MPGLEIQDWWVEESFMASQLSHGMDFCWDSCISILGMYYIINISPVQKTETRCQNCHSDISTKHYLYKIYGWDTL